MFEATCESLRTTTGQRIPSVIQTMIPFKSKKGNTYVSSLSVKGLYSKVKYLTNIKSDIVNIFREKLNKLSFLELLRHDHIKEKVILL